MSILKEIALRAVTQCAHEISAYPGWNPEAVRLLVEQLKTAIFNSIMLGASDEEIRDAIGMGER